MTGEGANRMCPTCGGHLHPGVATIPFLLSQEKAVMIKGVPAETCGDCHEPFMSGSITDEVMTLLSQLKRLGSEVSVVSFRDYALTYLGGTTGPSEMLRAARPSVWPSPYRWFESARRAPGAGSHGI